MSQNAPVETLDRYIDAIGKLGALPTDKIKWEVYFLLNNLFMDGFDVGVERTKDTFEKEYSHDAAMAALPAILATAPFSPERDVEAAIEVGLAYAKLALEPEVKP